MKRLVGSLLGLVVLAGVILIGAINIETGGGEVETATIDKYVADFTVRSDGELRVIETLTVNFPGFRHGIFRFFDTRDPNFSHHRLIPKDIEVTREGSPEPFEVQTTGRGRYRNVKIGSAATTVTGPNVYRI
jgi:hypothetical protein